MQHVDLYVGEGLIPLVVETDHNSDISTVALMSQPTPNSLFFQTFNLDVRHIKESNNIIADALSCATLL